MLGGVTDAVVIVLPLVVVVVARRWLTREVGATVRLRADEESLHHR